MSEPQGDTILVDIDREERRLAAAVEAGADIDVAAEIANTVLPLLKQAVTSLATMDMQLVGALDLITDDMADLMEDEEDEEDDDIPHGLQQSLIAVLTANVSIAALISREVCATEDHPNDPRTWEYVQEVIRDTQTLIGVLEEETDLEKEETDAPSEKA